MGTSMGYNSSTTTSNRLIHNHQPHVSTNLFYAARHDGPGLGFKRYTLDDNSSVIMLSKPTPIALCARSYRHTTSWMSPTPPMPLRPCHGDKRTRPRNGTCVAGPTLPSCRAYASVQHAGTSSKAGWSAGEPGFSALAWPLADKPTPYEIFHMSKGTAYSKARYYELVKIYHPDRHHHTRDDGIPHLTKLERYRLVVAANDILSNPAKRRQYDLYGAGWAGTSDMRMSYKDIDRRWRQQPGNASQNATWEDWEKWYQQRDGAKQEPVYMSNGAFIAAVTLLVLVAGWGQVARAGSHSVHLVEKQEEKHEAISRALHLKNAENTGKSREERIQKFLKQRDGWD